MLDGNDVMLQRNKAEMQRNNVDDSKPLRKNFELKRKRVD